MRSAWPDRGRRPRPRACSRSHAQSAASSWTRSARPGRPPSCWCHSAGSAPMTPPCSTGWTEGRSVNRMLDFLWVEGVLTIAGRAGSERLWELSERWFPPWTPREQLSEAELTDRAVGHALRALGVATPAQVSKHFLRPGLGWRYPDLQGSLTRLPRSGELLPVEIAGLAGAWYLHRDSLPLLERGWQPRTVLLSPFDNLLADRGRTRQLFAFDYSAGIYVSAP